MVGQLILDQPVGVRVPAPQPVEIPASTVDARGYCVFQFD